MSAEKELEQIAGEIEALSGRFIQSSSLGSYLRSEDQAEFKRLAVEAKSILDAALGPLNDFSTNVILTINKGSGGFIDGPSYACAQETRALIKGAVNHLRRRHGISAADSSATKLFYVDSSRLAELRGIKSSKFDLTKLVRLCEELNIAYENDCLMTIAMLVRGIVDHIPPIFSQTTFVQVANNYAGSQSFKGSMQRLDQSLRNVADAHLHTQVRARETLPTNPQVDFRADVDVLLSEVVRLLK